MFDYVLVPFDGGPELRAAFAPAADLAWRCGAKVVVVSTTAATDEESRLLVKSLAITQSGADVDFWVDLDRTIGDALVEAAVHRPNSLICVASRHKQTGLVRRRNAVIPIPRQVFTETSVPIMALGPETDVSAGLPMTEVVMIHDGSDRCAGTLAIAGDWARGLRLAVRLVSFLSPNALEDERNWLVERMEAVLAELAPTVPTASLEIVESRDHVETMEAFLTEHRESFFVVGPDAEGSQTADPGSFAAGLLRVTPQALLFPARPTS
jgi:hypothetical protein